MKIVRHVLASFLLLLLFTGAAAGPKEEPLLIFENRKVSVRVPAGFEAKAARAENGVTLLHLQHEVEKISVDLRFLPDAEGRFANARARREIMAGMFDEYVGESSEKGMQFEELEPRTGAGTYCLFTDQKLVGKASLPPNDYLHVTAGVKAWPGVLVVFRCFSNDTTSEGYHAVMRMLRESVQEVPVPLK
jgi:hypothetical protein